MKPKSDMSKPSARQVCQIRYYLFHVEYHKLFESIKTCVHSNGGAISLGFIYRQLIWICHQNGKVVFLDITVTISFWRIYQFLLFHLEFDICIDNHMDIGCGYIQWSHAFWDTIYSITSQYMLNWPLFGISYKISQTNISKIVDLLTHHPESCNKHITLLNYTWSNTGFSHFIWSGLFFDL